MLACRAHREAAWIAGSSPAMDDNDVTALLTIVTD
jgi:hypothetical protein